MEKMMTMILANRLYCESENHFPRTSSGRNAVTRSQPFFESLKTQILGYTAGIACRTLHSYPRYHSFTGVRIETVPILGLRKACHHHSFTGVRIETICGGRSASVKIITPSRECGLKHGMVLSRRALKGSLLHGSAD